jgi:hypothetical protein
MTVRKAAAAGTPLPDLARLTAGLSGVLGGPVAVLERRPNVRSSTAASEILICRLPDGAVVQLLGKYGSAEDLDETYGHKGGVPFEAAVYREILTPFRDCTVPCRGACRGTRPGEIWLFCDYLADALLVQKVDDGLSLATRWAADFHRTNAARLATAPLRLLRAYDRSYYQGWPERTLRFGGRLSRELPWLTPLCGRFAEAAELLLAAPQTVIHGEYYPHNVLAAGGEVYPIDWESAAIAAGEIDIVCLTDGWAEETVAACAQAYRQARWPDGEPPAFARTLDAARVYVSLRWMGDRPEWTRARDMRWRFDGLRAAGERLGLI